MELTSGPGRPPHPHAPKASPSFPSRRVVERTMGWFMPRRLARDHGALPDRSSVRIYLPVIALMARRMAKSMK